MTLTRPPHPSPGAHLPPGWAIAEERLDPEAFLMLYGAVGESVRWDERLRMEPERLADHLAAPTTRLFLLKEPSGLSVFANSKTAARNPRCLPISA